MVHLFECRGVGDALVRQGKGIRSIWSICRHGVIARYGQLAFSYTASFLLSYAACLLPSRFTAASATAGVAMYAPSYSARFPNRRAAGLSAADGQDDIQQHSWLFAVHRLVHRLVHRW